MREQCCCSFLPKLITSNIFKLLSSEVVLKRNPLQLAAMLSILPTMRGCGFGWSLTIHHLLMCARMCFTNSIPSGCFFQNLTCPSQLAVTMNSVLQQTQSSLTHSSLSHTPLRETTHSLIFLSPTHFVQTTCVTTSRCM